MYRQLIYSSGGGVIGNESIAEKEYKITLAIGLGGTGIDCLRRLKRRVYETVEPDQPGNPFSGYSHIKFLAVDTDRHAVREDGLVDSLDADTEFICLSSPVPMEDPDAAKAFFARHHSELGWLDAQKLADKLGGFRIFDAENGAGGVRQVGRMYLIMNSDMFVEKIKHILLEAMGVLQDFYSIHIHIFSGLGGGTGSGMFLDIGYLVKKALDDIGSKHCELLGYCFLPDVNLSKLGASAKPETSVLIQANAYAAIKELDYWINPIIKQVEWDQQYRGFRIGPTSDSPFSCCQLICATDMNGALTVNSYDYVMSVVSEYILQYIVSDEPYRLRPESQQYSSGISILRVPKEHGAEHAYNVLRASGAAVPNREIMTYLGSKLFKAFSGITDNHPSNEEIMRFTEENSADIHNLYKLVMDKTSTTVVCPLFEEGVLLNSFKEHGMEVSDELILPVEITEFFHHEINKIANQVEKNIAVLTDDWSWERIGKGGNNNSIVWKVFSALDQAVTDPDRGPFYAAEILNGADKKNLVDILKENMEKLRQHLYELSRDRRLRMEEVKRARESYLHTFFPWNRRSAFDALIAEINMYFTLTAEKIVLEKMVDMIRKIIGQLEKLYNEYFIPYSGVVQRIQDTFCDNDRSMSRDAVFAIKGNPLFGSISDPDAHMKNLLNEAVDSMDLSREAARFHGSFIRAVDVWTSKDESKIVRFVSDYVNDVFSSYQNRNFEEYIKMLYGEIDQPMLQDRIYKEIIMPLYATALPPIWGGIDGPYMEYSFFKSVIVPKQSENVHAAVKRLIEENPDLYFVQGESVSRIAFISALVGVPMYGCKEIDSYKQAYQHTAAIPGRHIYEGTQEDSRDWRELQDPIPYSMIENPTPEMMENEKLYSRAIESGILYSYGGNSGIYKVDVFGEIEDIEKLAKEAIDRSDTMIAKEVIRTIDEYPQDREPINTILIPNDGTRGNEDRVRKDYVMASAVILKIIKRQLDTMDRLQAIKEKMKQLVG